MREPLVHEIPLDESEVLDVAATSRGLFIHVVAPAPACGHQGDASSWARLIPRLDADEDVDLDTAATLDLGLGESTSVASVGEAALVAVKSPRRPNVDPGRLVWVGGVRAPSIEVGPGPDSIAVSSDGAFAVVACEAEAPEADECDAEASTLDAPGSIFIVELLAGPERARVAAVVTGTALYEMGLQHEPARAGSDREIEPEFVAIAPRGEFALVTLQEQSAVAVVDLRPLRSAAPEEKRSGVEAAGARCLAGVVLLTQSGRDEKGHVRGACPDGIAISPDASLAVTADEAGPKAREMQGLTFLDLRDGSANVRVASRHSLFDLDPALEPVPARTRNRLRPPKKVVKAGARKRLPRLDPEGVAFARHGDRLILAVAIERSAPGEEAGSVLFLDATGVLDGEPPRRIDRKLVGLTLGARPETLEFTPDGAMVFVACERDGGTITSIGIDGP